jgi:hypothetical protein
VGVEVHGAIFKEGVFDSSFFLVFYNCKYSVERVSSSLSPSQGALFHLKFLKVCRGGCGTFHVYEYTKLRSDRGMRSFLTGKLDLL